MYKTTWDGTKAVMVAVGRSLLSDGRATFAIARGKAVLKVRCDWLDMRSMADVGFAVEEVVRNCMTFVKRGGWDEDSKERRRLVRRILAQTDLVMKAFNRAYRKAWKRTKGTQVVKGLALNRDRSEPVVFYLVSSHQKPQPAHRDLQGKILVDRFWRSSLEGHEKYDEVARYVRDNKVRTVQWACGAPHYLIRRINCRHRLIPLRIDDVIGSSLKQVNDKFQKEVRGVRRPLTDGKRAEIFADLKSVILKEIEKTGL